MGAIAVVIGNFLVSLFTALLSSKMVKAIAGLFTVTFLGKALTVLGISFITYQGSQFTLDFAYSAMQSVFQSLPSAPSQWLQVLWMGVYELRVDDALTNILTAYATAWAIVTTKATSNLAVTK